MEKKRWQRCTQWWAQSLFFAGASSVEIIVRKAAAGVFLLCGNHPVLCPQTEAHRCSCWRTSSAHCFLIWCLELPYFLFLEISWVKHSKVILFGELEVSQGRSGDGGVCCVGCIEVLEKMALCLDRSVCCFWCLLLPRLSEPVLSEAELWILRGRCLSPKYKCLIRPDTAEAFPWHLCCRLSNPQEHTGWWEAPQTMSETA